MNPALPFCRFHFLTWHHQNEPGVDQLDLGGDEAALDIKPSRGKGEKLGLVNVVYSVFWCLSFDSAAVWGGVVTDGRVSSKMKVNFSRSYDQIRMWSNLKKENAGLAPNWYVVPAVLVGRFIQQDNLWNCNFNNSVTKYVVYFEKKGLLSLKERGNTAKSMQGQLEYFVP